MVLTPPRERDPALAREWRAKGLWDSAPFSHFFETTCKRLGTREAIVEGSVRIPFAELRAKVELLAGSLAAAGIGRGTVVAVQLPNWWETVVVYGALMRLGAVINPVLPAYRERELRFILNEGGAEVLFVPGGFRGYDHRDLAARLAAATPSLRRIVVVRDEPRDDQSAYGSLAEAGGPLPPPPRGEDLLLLMYTSGTTADPKGVLHSHQTLLYEVRSLEQVHAFTERDVTLMPSPLAHVSGLIHACLVPFVLGTRAVLMDRWDAGRALSLIAEEGVTYMVGAPVFLSELTHHPDLRPDAIRSLRLFSCGGAGVSPELIRESRKRLGCSSKRVYGSTEFPTLTTTGPDDPAARGIATEGRVIGAAALRIVDDAGEDLLPGREGEILARGPECFLGYRNGALDAEAFTANGWYRTGDLGVVDREGYLTVTGRKKDIVIRKGEKISAPEVEVVIARHPAVAEVAVIALPDPTTGERACACVRLVPQASLSLTELSAFLREAGLSAHKIPEALEVLEDFPRTASGKVRKHRLREQLTRA